MKTYNAYDENMYVKDAFEKARRGELILVIRTQIKCGEKCMEIFKEEL